MTTRTCRAIVAAVAVVLSSSAASAGDVSVVMKDGRVTVVAQNVPLRQILAEWGRVGQTKIVGAEKLAGPPVTLHLENVTERQALETLLRSASGYLAAPRTVPVASASHYDRIVILPTSTAPPVTASASPSRPAPAMAPPPVAAEPQAGNENADEEASDLPADLTEAQRMGVDAADVGQNPEPETTFDYANPQLMLQRRQQQQQQQQGATPAGAATPGTILQPPPQTPNVFPGTGSPRPPGSTSVSPTSARPGEVVEQPQQVNPYGLPAGVQPGSVQGPAVQPDCSKYLNPYQPKPPEGQ